MFCNRFLLLLLLSLPAAATILTFDITNLNFPVSENFPEGLMVPSDYGNRVNSSSQVVGDNTFNYGVGLEGYTPNVIVGYGPFSIFTGGPSLWRYDYGDLDRVLYQGSTTSTIGNNYDYLLIEFFADPGYEVILHGFDLGAWFQQDRQIDGVAVYDNTYSGFFPAQNRVYFDSAPTILGNGPSRSSYNFTTPIRGNIINILIDARNIGNDSELIGIDNIRFGQDTSQVPEPATVLLTAAGLLYAGPSRKAKS